MPLNAHEQKALSIRLSEVITNEFGFSGPATEKYPSNRESIGGVATDTFMVACERLVVQMTAVTELLTMFLQRIAVDTGQGSAEQTQARKPGRPKNPPKDQAPAQQAQPPQSNGAQAGFGKPADDDPFGDPNENKPQNEDPFAVPGESKPSAPPPPPAEPEKPLTDVEVKNALRTYMQAFGTEGTNRLTDLLTRVAGVKRFSDLPANKWSAVVTAARQELGGK